MRYLITGISGFVGGHYVERLLSKYPGTEIIGADLENPRFDTFAKELRGKITFHRGSLLDRAWVFGLIEKGIPDRVVNLASFSSVAFSWKNPVDCFVNNTNIFLNLIEAVRVAKSRAKILSVGSSEEYGAVEEKDIPLSETRPANPANPYAVARLAQEDISRVYAAGYGIKVVCTRSFNHVGPGQPDIFAVSSFARQLVESKMGLRDRISCGDLGITRDFIDVRDVVRAYDLLLEKGKPGEIYNVCSGEGHRLSEIMDMLKKKAGVDTPAELDKNLVRPVDNPVIVGSCAKLEKDTGFKREYGLSRSLDDMLGYWKKALAETPKCRDK